MTKAYSLVQEEVAAKAAALRLEGQIGAEYWCPWRGGVRLQYRHPVLGNGDQYMAVPRGNMYKRFLRQLTQLGVPFEKNLYNDVVYLSVPAAAYLLLYGLGRERFHKE